MTFLEFLVVLPLIIVCVLVLIPSRCYRLIKIISLYGSFSVLVVSLLLFFKYDRNFIGFQFISNREIFQSINVYYSLGIDGVSLLFVILTALIIPLCILCSWTTVERRIKDFMVLLFLTEFLLFNVFSVLDLLLFYVFFESILIPMFFIIGIWGSRERRIHAVYQFFLYTLAGSVLMLLGILLVYFETGSTNLYVLLNSNFSSIREIFVWFSFFLSFAVKVPMVPVHIWLPEAHVEAPTAGSVILAGILLKMGTYGLIRFSLPIMPYGTQFFVPLVFVLSVVSIIYSSCTTIRQIDLKKVIAYSSVAHMNFVTIGIMCLNVQGVEGSLYLMLGHGFVSSALFLCVGMLYERYHTRIISYYGGLVYGMPIFAVLFLIFTLGNISFPGTSNFVGEILVLMGIFSVNIFITILASIGVILGAVYAVWLYNRVVFGSVKVPYMGYYSDINKREWFIYLPLVFCVIGFGVFPGSLLSVMECSIFDILADRL